MTLNYGLRWDTTFGLFQASGVSQTFNPGVQTIRGLQLPLPTGVPHDYRSAFAPRLGIAYIPDRIEDLVIRAGIGLYYNDLRRMAGRPRSRPSIRRRHFSPASSPAILVACRAPPMAALAW